MGHDAKGLKVLQEFKKFLVECKDVDAQDVQDVASWRSCSRVEELS